MTGRGRGKRGEVAVEDGVRVGLVGLGRMGDFHATNLAGRIPLAQLVRIVDADEGVVRDVSGRLGGIEWSTDYADLLNDPGIEAVVIASPTPLHADMIEAAAGAGKHVFCEKPISLEMESTYGAIEAARKAGIKLQVGFHRRFDPDYRRAWQKIAAGEVGEVYLFRTSLRDMRPPGFDYIKGSGGFFADVTLHDFDTASWLIGEIEEVTALGAALSVAGYGYECSSEIMGSKATLRVDNHRRSSVETLTPDSSHQDYVSDFVERFADAYGVGLESFVRAVREDRDPEVSGADAAAAFVLAKAAERSHREGRTVRLTNETRDGEVFYRKAD